MTMVNGRKTRTQSTFKRIVRTDSIVAWTSFYEECEVVYADGEKKIYDIPYSQILMYAT